MYPANIIITRTNISISIMYEIKQEELKLSPEKVVLLVHIYKSLAQNSCLLRIYIKFIESNIYKFKIQIKIDG